MKKNTLGAIAVLLSTSTLLTSCSAITGIFKAGMGFGIFIVIFFIVVILAIVMKARKR